MARIEGLHHVTAIAGEPQANIDFYAGVLGLRLVKLTVNYVSPVLRRWSGSSGNHNDVLPMAGCISGAHRHRAIDRYILCCTRQIVTVLADKNGLRTD